MRLFLLVLWLGSSMAPLRGATLERLSLDDMAQKSTAIVRGRVAGSHAAFRGSTIYTHYRIQVSESWKGAQQASVEVLVPGGVSAGIRQTYSGVPRLAEGKDYVLFLWTGPSGLTQIIGYTQGVFEVPKRASGETMAYRAAATETMLDPASGHPVKDEPVEITLRALNSRIAAAISKGATR